MRTTDVHRGYFPHSVTNTKKALHTNDLSSSPNSDVGCVKGLTFSTFPWLPLTPTDRHVLISTNSSLCSPRPSLVLNSCEFVSGVVLQDFPAEIFLQRPSITKSLLSLLGLKPLSVGDNSIPLSAIKCLRELSTLLLSRHRFYHDPALYCPKQDFGSQTASSTSSGTVRASCSTSQSTLSSDPRPSVIGRNEPRMRGDGRDGDSPSSVDSSHTVPDQAPSVSDTDSEDAIILQFSQLTLPEFATDVLFHVTPLLKTGTTEMFVASLYLLHEALKLIRIAMTSEIWDDSSAAGRALIDKLLDSFETLGEVIHYHYLQCHGTDDDESSCPAVSDEAFIHHRLSTIAVVALVKKLIQELVPLEKAKDVLPESLSLSLYLAVMDQGLLYCTPDVRPFLLAVIQRCLPSKHRLYQQVASICNSMDSACMFLHEIDKESTNVERLLDLAEASLRSLHYHRILTLADKFVQLCSDICSSSNGKLLRYSGRILLRFLACPEQDVKLQTYAACLKIVKDVINVEESIKARPSATERIHFLLDSKILYEICCFGLFDEQEKVCSQAEDLMCHLFQGQLLMSPTTWCVFLQACVPVLPVLQALASRKTQLSACILGLLEPSASRSKSAEFEVLPDLEKLRGSLRLLLCQDQSARLKGAKSVLYYLTKETSSSLKLPSIDNYTLNDVADLLLMDHAIHLDTHNSGRSVFQVEGLVQIFGIFTAANTEAGLRKSALEQIAIILQDVTLHKAFLSQGGLDKILDCMVKATTASTAESDQDMLGMIPACLCILRHVLHEDPLLRRQFARQDYIYYLLIRGGLLCYTDCRARYHLAHVAVLLLFDEVACLSIAEAQPVNHFTLPKCISQKYKLPFRCQTTPSHSSYRMEDSSADDSLNKSSVAWKLLRIAWNVAWHGGVEGLMDKIKSGALKESVASFNSRLALTAEDQLFLKCSHVPTSLNQCLLSVCDAPSHHAVKVSLWRLSGWLLTNMLTHNGMDTNKACPDITQLLLQLDFKTALARFIGIVPVSVDDKILLTEVLSFLMLLMKSLALNPSCLDFLHWLGNAACMPTSILIGLLNQTNKPGDAEVDRHDHQRQGEVGSSVQRMLHKQLVTFFGSYVQCLPLSSEAWRRKTGYLGGSLAHGLLLSLNSADAAHFYDLPSLENTLHSLVHVTARPGWSLDWKDGDSLSLCQHLLNSLLEVISAFHVGRGGTAMSYMGKGVTKSATVCLCHLAHEMANRAHQKNWSTEWLYTKQRQDGLAEIGLEWLIPLWSYRDPEVRAAGLGIATVLSSVESGRVTMTKGCQHLPGGLWAVAFGVLLDQSECSIVRRQAALLLVNLMSERLPERDTDSLNSRKETWIGPFVHDQQTQLCLSGAPALHAVLEHYNIYQGITASLYHFYGQASIQPVSIVEDSTVISSSVASGLSTATTPDVGSSQSNGGSPNTVGQPNLMEEDQPQIFSSSADSGGLSAGTSLAVQSNQGSSKSSSSYSAGRAVTRPNTTGRYISVVTPSLVAAFSCLLRNLIALSPQETIVMIDKEGILKQLIRLVDVEGISNLLHRLTLSSSPEHSKTCLQLSGHLVMCCDILRLYQAYKQAQDQCKTTSVDDKSVFLLACRLLGLSSTSATGSSIWQQIHDVWKCVFMLMLTQVKACGHDGFQDLKPVIVSHWTVITAAIIHIVKSPMALSTRIVSLNFLASLLDKMHGWQSSQVRRKEDVQSCQGDVEEDGDDVMNAVHVLDEERTTAGCAASSGSWLCSVLLQAFDGTLSRSLDNPGSASEKTSIICALRNLLAISHQAKKTAVKSGLIESILDSMQHTHAKLNVECLQHPRPVSKNKEEPLLLQLVSQMGLLQNCLCGSQEAKMTSLEAGLTSVLLKLWSWCLLDNRLLAATLSLLAGYTANCTPACSSLAQCLPGQTGSSLLHRIIQQIDREKKQVIGQIKDHQQQTKGLFIVLSNVIVAAECRNALWKSGFLQTFSQVCPERKQTSSRRSLTGKQLTAALWLQLLANLTLSTEGQQMVMRIPDVLELLLLLGESANDDVSKLATLTLHNLCFHSANKPKLLASEKMLPFFEKRLVSGSKSAQSMVVNALWALLYESQKAKAILKSSAIFQCLLDAQSQALISPHQTLTLPAKGQNGRDNSLYQALSSVLALMID
ncbi:rotatin-like [Patiria miniata]|uniref:Rotatin n=1 Tax=Patiria miniata TaxID=46514 RepID=A0A914ATL2_PATMI|nr:rotatin-like [Patiria miniata]